MHVKILWLVGLVAMAAAGYWWTNRPQPLAVETALVTRGPMEVAVSEQGETRAHDRYTVTAPMAGRLLRIELHAGDRVARGQVLAVLHPVPLDPRSRSEARARVAAAEALQREAGERIAQAQASLELAQRELSRTEKLWRSGDVPQQKVEQVRSAETVARRDVDAARFRESAARHEVERARSALLTGDAAPTAVPVRAPASGRLLRIAEASERILQPGEPILTLGDAGHLEVVVDVLSSDAVKIRGGQTVWIEQWGGDRALRGVVQTVEPLGFTKVSALGVEEKRVPVRVEFVDPPGALGDGYRVEARIVIWQRGDALKTPASAVFRCGDNWCVFSAAGDRAIRRGIRVGQRNENEMEVLDGLSNGDRVIAHPPRDLAEGALIVYPDAIAAR